jgi:hypothetical protein
MKRLAILFALLGVMAGAASAASTHGSVGRGHGITGPGQDSNPCNPPGTLDLNYDGTAENGYCWQYAGIGAPYYGAFAECYSASGGVCGIELFLTGVGYPCNNLTLYVWEDAAGIPGNVLSSTPGVNPCPVSTWPVVNAEDFAIANTAVNGNFWVGYWSDDSAQPCGYFIGADLDGCGRGCPFTNIAPGIGYPTGWNNVSIVWGQTAAIGIGAWVGGGAPVPTKLTTWGRIKNMYH